MRRHNLLGALAVLAVVLGSTFVLGADAVKAADTIARPDTVGSVGRWTSLALDASGKPVVAYLDQTNADLKVLHCGNATCTSGNSITAADPNSVLDWGISMQLDGSGKPVVAYLTLADQYSLKLLRCGDGNCGSGNSVQVVDKGTNYPDPLGRHFIGYYQSVVHDQSGNPVISYQHIYPGYKLSLQLARCNDPTCSTSVKTELRPELGDGQGFGNSLALDGQGNPVVSFVGTIAGGAQVKVLHCGNAGCTSGNSVSVVGTSGGGPTPSKSLHTALALDGAGNPVVAFQDGSLHLRVVHCNDPLCAGGDESDQLIDARGPTGLYVSMVLDSLGNPVVAYHSHTFGELEVLHCGNPNCSSGNTIQAVLRDDHAGAYSSVQLNALGRPVISHNYQDAGDLGVVVCNSVPCDGLPVDTDSDGCTDAAEQQTASGSQTSGGLRNPNSFWDFFDTPDQNGYRDRVVTDADVQRVADRYGKSGNPSGDPLAPPPDATSYHPAFDRGPPAPGGDPWDLTQGDGVITVADISRASAQGGHHCN